MNNKLIRFCVSVIIHIVGFNTLYTIYNDKHFIYNLIRVFNLSLYTVIIYFLFSKDSIENHKPFILFITVLFILINGCKMLNLI